MLGDYVYINSYVGKPIIFSEFQKEYSKGIKKKFVNHEISINSKVSTYLSKYFKEFSIHQISSLDMDKSKCISNLSIYAHQRERIYFTSVVLEDVPNDLELRKILESIYKNSSELVKISSQLVVADTFSLNKDVFISLLLNTVIYCYQHKKEIPVNFLAIYDGKEIISERIDETVYSKINLIKEAEFVNQTNFYCCEQLNTSLCLAEIINNASFISTYSDNFYLNGRWRLDHKWVIFPLEISITKLISNIIIADKNIVFHN